MKSILPLAAAAIALFGVTAFAADVTEVKVHVLDGFEGDTSSIASICQTKAGVAYDPATVTRDVTTLKDSGEFEEVAVDARRTAAGVEVTFSVRRKMRFAGPVAVRGNDALGESKIAKASGLQDGYPYGEAELAAAAEKVRLAYLKKDYPDARVTYETKPIGGNDVNVTFVVDEGVRQRIADFVFEGAAHAVDVSVWKSMLPSYELEDGLFDVAELHAAIDDLPWWNPLGWFADSPVTKDQLATCCEKIAAVYRNHGYLDATVTGPRRVPDGDGRANVVFTVEEGVQYRVGKSSVKGLTRYPEDKIVELSALPAAGSVAAESALNEAAHRIEVTVGSGDVGLADTRVAVKRLPTDDPSTCDIVYQVTEGVPVVINEVKITGNDYTKDNVIRREISLGPGNRMLADRAEKSKHRLENLDYFSRVSYSLAPTDRGKDANGNEYRDLVYEVEEKNTGSFMVGIGASTVDSVYISAEVNQNNFDLFAPTKLFRGAGQKGRVYVAWGPRYQSAEIGFSEPYFLARHLELSVDIYRRLRWYDEYDLIRTGAMASLAYPVKFWPTWEAFGSLGVGFSGEFIEFDDVEKGIWEFKGREVSFKDEDRRYGDAFEPVVHLFWVKDSRDNFRMPTTGHRTKLFADVAPACDNQYWRLGVNHRSYFNVWKRFDHVLMVGLRAETVDGFGGDDVPIYNRMFLGGPRSIRGIRYRYASPMARRVDTHRNDYAPWGGQTLFCMNFEYTIPVVKMLRLAVFSDLGSVGEDVFDLDFSDSFAWTGGVGLRLDIPMFPIRLDFAVPFKEPDHCEKEAFSFLVGYDF